jgi:hypothetical protein
MGRCCDLTGAAPNFTLMIRTPGQRFSTWKSKSSPGAPTPLAAAPIGRDRRGKGGTRTRSRTRSSILRTRAIASRTVRAAIPVFAATSLVNAASSVPCCGKICRNRLTGRLAAGVSLRIEDA